MSPYAFVVMWVAQAALLGLVALALPRLLRVRQAGLLEAWWSVNALLVVMYPILPMMLPRRQTVTAPTLAAMADSTVVSLATGAGVSSLLSPMQWLAVVWTCGALIRLGWLIAGQRRLRRLATEGTPIVDDPALARARVLAASHKPRMSLHGEVPVIATDDTGPCAFGWGQVRVLVPRSLANLTEDQRVSVYLHELLHAVRFDVQRSYADEVWRLVWWWQPAVWWMQARLRLTRELHVDRAVVASTGGRRAYVEALLWCGDRPRTMALSSQVGGGRHALVRRVALLCEEVEMTRVRRWFTLGALITVLATASAVLDMHSPLRAAQISIGSPGAETDAGPLERAAVLPSLDAPAPRRVVSVEPVYGPSPFGFRFRVHVVVGANGAVVEARIPQTIPATVPAGEVRNAWDSARSAVLDAVRQWQFEPPAAAPMLLLTDVVVGSTESTGRLDSTGASTDPLATSSRQPLRVGGTIGPPTRLVHVAPVYPDIAKDAGVSGVVIVEATIDTQGNVGDVRVLRSIPLLDQAAIDAAKQWRYSPTYLNGEAVPIRMTITISFSLQ